MPLIPKLDKIFRYTCCGKYRYINISRFIIRINTTLGLGPGGDCWEWKAGVDKDGYGRFSVRKNNKQIATKSHRVAYEMFTGKLIPEGLFVCHKCDNPSCVNPDHLFLGTISDNTRDMFNKNRQNNRCAEYNGASKLNWEKVRKIRRLWSTNKYTLRELADMHRVTLYNISYVVNNKTWKE
jgi:hypothetical protein